MIKLEDYSDLIEKCSYCGYCQEACPVYLAELFEPYTARNRINLIKAVLIDNSWPVNAKVKEIIDCCLLCTNCVRTCSCQVPIDEIVVAARSKIQKGFEIRKTVTKKILTTRRFAGMLCRIGSVVTSLGFPLKDLPVLAQEPFEKKYSGIYPCRGEPRAKVAYFVGCATNFLYPDTGQSVVKVLNQNGIEVIIPTGQVCCGLPVIAEGDLESARKMIERNIQIFARLEVDAIITDCTSCGMMFKTKASKLLPEELATVAKAVADKFWEATDYLNTMGLTQKPKLLAEKFTYHVPCHHGWASTVKDAPRHLLAQIPEAEIDEMEKPESCCGAGGAFFLSHRELSEKIRSQKIQRIKNTNAATVVTQCPVCRFYIASKLNEQKVVHPIGFLAKAYGE